MRSNFCHGAVMMALIGAVSLATASLVLHARALRPAALVAVFPDDETTGSIERSAATRALPLSDDQRGLVFLGVINLPDVPEIELSRPIAALPAAVALQDLPAMVTSRVPLLRDYKFVKLDDRILLVRPDDRAVMLQIPRYRLLP